MKKTDEELRIIAKLMNERSSEPTEIEKVYDSLYDILNKKLPEVLDEGLYLNNSAIVRDVMDVMHYNELFTIIPQLSEKSIISLFGTSDCLSELFQIIGLKLDLYIKNNSNLPLLVIYHKVTEPCVYALTYADKLIELTVKEFLTVTNDLYKRGIEIRKLIKCFVVMTDKQSDKATFCIIPEHASLDDESLKLIKIFSKDFFVAADKRGRWIKTLSRMKDLERAIIVMLPNMSVDFSMLDNGFTSNNYKIIDDAVQFKQLIVERMNYCINFMIRAELANILMRVIKFYIVQEKKLTDKIELLAEDSVNLKDSEIREQVKGYRTRLLRQKEQIIVCRTNIEKLEKQILEFAAKFEHYLSNSFLHDLETGYDLEFYIQQLVNLFFLHIDSYQFEKVKDDIVKFSRVNYSCTAELEIYCKYVRGYDLTENEKRVIKNLPDNTWYNVKIKIAMSDILGYSDKKLKEIVLLIPEKTTGKEWYYYGMNLIDKKEYSNAKDAFMYALDFDYELAGKQLINLAEQHPECHINIEELAENLVPEANYLLGSNNSDNKYKKSIVNLKMAASKGHLDSTIMIADILFEKYKRKSWEQMKEEENIRAVNNVIILYKYICKKESKEEYRLRIGLMYCKLNEYQRAYDYLKDIHRPEAQYECAKMYQHGNGVAKNLNKAKSYYEEIEYDYRDTQKQLEKVLSQIQQKETNYSNRNSYKSKPESSYEGSSYCFITTAACMALHESKDCEQLNILRQFRDDHILKGEDGELLVKEYYRIGPILVELIDREWNPYAIYNELWEDYILPSCKLIYEKKWEKAKKIYIDMVICLCKRYRIDLEKSIERKYGIGESGM